MRHRYTALYCATNTPAYQRALLYLLFSFSACFQNSLEWGLHIRALSV
ncbi:hypothetical protein HMPREF3190_00402 [Umbribacter vaginalis]|nr:hypothetical protein HMPREF3190_00402 [Coriobacteriales bacterium DNF00809]